jgi:crossover junction endodeoxyribonuclease RuvC
MKFLGIDPGLRITGYGCVELRAGSPRATIVEAGVFRLARTDIARGEASSVAQRLVELERDMLELLGRVRPDRAAVEGIFAHSAHPATSAIMGHARGVILLALARERVPLIELKPAEVKKFLTGSGRAEKGQMQRAIQDCFRLGSLPKPPDVADALAIALCAAHRVSLDEVSARVTALTGDSIRTSRGKPRRRTLPADVLDR